MYISSFLEEIYMTVLLQGKILEVSDSQGNYGSLIDFTVSPKNDSEFSLLNEA